MDEDFAIRVNKVSKTFKLPHEKHSSLKGALIGRFKGGKRSFERQQVLKDVTFDIKKGEFFGIVGRNGSGKSTMLKMLAGIYTPTKGNIDVRGKLTPFIELGVGFNPELTGRENVFLNGALLGFNRKEMSAMYNDIVEFAELEKFMDQKLKNYSSGMQVRLAFSIAVRAQTAILLIDEVLAVGDVRFQQKCFEYFYRLKKENRTIVFVSHDMDSVQKFCDRAVVLHKGSLKFIGKPTEAAVMYKELNFPSHDIDGEEETTFPKPKLTLLDRGGKSKKTFVSGETMKVRVQWPHNERAQYIGIAIHRDDGLYVFGTNNVADRRWIEIGQTEADYDVELSLGNGQYYIEAAIFGSGESEKVFYDAHGPAFIVHNPKDWQGVVNLKHSWSQVK